MKLSQLNDVGKQIAEYRRKVGMTQQELALKSELSVQFIGYTENGQRKISLETLIKITNALDVELTSFFLNFETGDAELNQLIADIEHSSQKESYIHIFQEILDTANSD